METLLFWVAMVILLCYGLIVSCCYGDLIVLLFYCLLLLWRLYCSYCDDSSPFTQYCSLTDSNTIVLIVAIVFFLIVLLLYCSPYCSLRTIRLTVYKELEFSAESPVTHLGLQVSSLVTLQYSNSDSPWTPVLSPLESVF